MFKVFELLADFIVYKILNMAPASNLGESLHFFIYNSLKILTLILVIGFIIGILRDFISPEKTRKLLSKKKAGFGNIIAAIIAVITPVEDFSVIPVFIGFLEAGVPIGIAFTYLITAPITNEVGFAVFWSLFGVKTAILYYTCGIIIGILSGLIIGWLKLDKCIKPYIYEEAKRINDNKKKRTFKSVILDAKNSSFQFLKSFWIYILIGVAIAAIISQYIPVSLITDYIGPYNPFSVLLVVIPVFFMYINISGALPIILIFTNLGVPVGTIMAFTFAATVSSIPELLVLKRALKLSLLIIYISILYISIIIAGYLINYAYRVI